jgi:hypothetical protein
MHNDYGHQEEDEDESFAPATMMRMNSIEETEAKTITDIRWKRPPIDPEFNPSTSAIAFQWTAVDLMSGEPLPSHPRGNGLTVPGASVGPVPIIRCVCVEFMCVGGVL